MCVSFDENLISSRTVQFGFVRFQIENFPTRRFSFCDASGNDRARDKIGSFFASLYCDSLHFIGFHRIEDVERQSLLQIKQEGKVL